MFEAINRSRRGVCSRLRAFRVFGRASRGVQQSTRPQREHCSETIKARSVTFRGRDGGKEEEFNTSRASSHRARLRASERALHRGGRAKPARFPPIIYGDYYFRAVRRERTERQRERRRCDEERGGEGRGARGRERERERTDGKGKWRGGKKEPGESDLSPVSEL